MSFISHFANNIMQLTEQQKQESAKQFYISALHTFGENGNKLLELLDDIESGELQWIDPTTFAMSY